jgi:hypothetical protein
VLQQYEERQNQLRLDVFWTVTHRFAKIRSKRLQAAVAAAVGRDLSDELVMASEPVAPTDISGDVVSEAHEQGDTASCKTHKRTRGNADRRTSDDCIEDNLGHGGFDMEHT